MRKSLVFLAAGLLTACGGSGGESSEPTACSNDGQKQFVLNNLYDWYLWNDMLPANINIADYASPEELVAQVTQTFGPQNPGGGPLDLFSSVGSLQADQQFFGEGKYEGFGFSFTFDGGDMRFSRVFVESPANAAGFARGQTVLSLDGTTIAALGTPAAVSTALGKETVVFEIDDPVSGVFTVSVTKAIVTINPIPQRRVINMGPGVPPVGYMEFATFISTAHDGLDGNDFDDVFAEFVAAGVEDVIIDLRYNGGGLVETAELLGDYLGGFANDGQVFSNTEFNADRAVANNTTSFFAREGSSIDLRRLIIVASGGTASASELVTNSVDPYLADGVYIVGDNTFGKPVGQIGIDFCEKILRPTSFKLTNAAGFGDYFDGLPVDCPATDDLDFVVGGDSDPNIIAALSYVNGAGCPVVSLPGGQQKATQPFDRVLPDHDGRPEREFAGAH